MKSVTIAFLCFFSCNLAIVPQSIAQTLDVRRMAGGLIRVQSETGVDLVIRPNSKTEVPKDLKSVRSLILGDEMERVVLQLNGQPLVGSPKSGADIRIAALTVESVLIGKKRAGIQLQGRDLNILVASVELLSDQGFISTRGQRDINLLILTFKDAKKLHTGRTNLWLGASKIQQIALNPLTEFDAASVEKFYKSLNKNRTLPTAVVPTVKVPNPLLKFGDRQVVLLKELE